MLLMIEIFFYHHKYLTIWKWLIIQILMEV